MRDHNKRKRRRISSAPTEPREILSRVGIPGLFVTGTHTDIGKTTATAALAGAFRRLHIRVGVCKAIASGCPGNPKRGNRDRTSADGLVSPDAELAARAAGLDLTDDALRQFISPIRYAAPVSPHVAAAREGRAPDWRRLADAIAYWRAHCDFLLVEGVGGWLVPLNNQYFTIADLAEILALPVVVVTGTYLGTLNHTALTVESIQARNMEVAGIVANRVPLRRDLVVRSNLDELSRVTQTPLLAALPENGHVSQTHIPMAFIKALEPFARRWWRRYSRNA